MKLTPEQQHLVERHVAHARVVARETRTWLTYDERLSAAFWGLCWAAGCWRPEREANFNSYAKLLMVRAIKYESLLLVFAVGKTAKNPIGIEHDNKLAFKVLDDEPNRERLSEIEELAAKLWPRGREAMGHLLDGLTIPDMAKRMGIVYGYAHRVYGRAIKEIRQQLA